MNNYEQELRDKWNNINYRQGGSLQLGITHPLEWHVGYFSSEAKSIVIVSDDPVNKIESSKSIQASCKPRKDGRFATSLTLISREQEDVFVTMCVDLIGFSGDETNRKQSLLKVLKRYAAWHKLLQHNNSALLGSAAQKGLIGELLYLKEKVEKGMGPLDAIVGWVGPDGADQDFVYDDGWHEIKTTGASSSGITISSVEQLDNVEKGELIINRIDKCAPAQAGAFTLYGLVHQIINTIRSYPDALDTFIIKLATAGYIDMKEYDQQKFVFASRQIFDVNESFPRIRRKDLPVEIMNTTYVLSIPSLITWQK